MQIYGLCVQHTLTHATHLGYQITSNTCWVNKGLYSDTLKSVFYDKGLILRDSIDMCIKYVSELIKYTLRNVYFNLINLKRVSFDRQCIESPLPGVTTITSTPTPQREARFRSQAPSNSIKRKSLGQEVGLCLDNDLRHSYDNRTRPR